MNISHPELLLLYESVLPKEIKENITEFINEVEQNKNEYKCQMLWISDQSIGGIGGYCMPANPVLNPFPSGIMRELYRPLQYARSEIEICDIRLHARYAVQMSGMHLEAVCRLYLKQTKALGTLRFNNTTLGKAIQQIQSSGNIDPFIIDSLFNFTKVYNRSKHEINQNNSRDRLFNPYDACVAYFISRILGVNILRLLNIENSFLCLEILDYIDEA